MINIHLRYNALSKVNEKWPREKKEQTRNNSKIMLIFAKTTPTRKYSKLKTIDKMHILRKTQRNCAHPKSTE